MTEGMAGLRADERFWIVDPADVSHLMNELRIFGYTDRVLAEEESVEISPDQTYYEIRITRHHVHKHR